MIDFGKTTPIPEGSHIDHHSPWVRGNHEDGYLTGIDSLISLMEEILQEVTTSIVSTGDS